MKTVNIYNFYQTMLYYNRDDKMPSHKIHIKIAQDINERLKLDKNLFMLGSILPDLYENKSNHSISHFKTNPKNHQFYNKELFIKKYNINDTIILGYLVHLLTDEFYNSYVKNNYFIIKDGKLSGIKKINGQVLYDEPDEICYLKQVEFNKYDKYLMKSGKFYLFDDFNILDKIPIIDECDYSKDYIYKYMKNFNNEINDYKLNKEINIKYEIFTKEELDKLYNDCVEYINNYIDNLLKNNLKN